MATPKRRQQEGIGIRGRRAAGSGKTACGVAVTMTVQPTAAGTWAKLVHTTVDSPSLVIGDGATTLVLRPAEGTDGVAAAAEFAQELSGTGPVPARAGRATLLP
jgi:hypothetical protein